MDCLFKAADVTHDDGEVHLEKLLDLLPPDIEELALNMAKGCIHPQGDNQCERAFWFHKCWKAADPVHYFLP